MSLEERRSFCRLKQSAAADATLPPRAHDSEALDQLFRGPPQTREFQNRQPILFRDPSAERESERFHAGIEKLDLELSIDDRSRLSNQLIQPLLRDRAITSLVYVTSMAYARRLSVDEDSKGCGSSASGWSHDEVEIARVEPVSGTAAKAAAGG